MDVSIDVDVWCYECDTQLEANYDPKKCRAFVYPCQKCLDDARFDAKTQERNRLDTHGD